MELLAPVTRPDKVICIGMNYRDHCEEQGAPVPTEPVVFNKFPSSIVGPYDPIPYPEVTKVAIFSSYSLFKHFNYFFPQGAGLGS